MLPKPSFLHFKTTVLLAASLLVFSSSQAADVAGSRPNIVFILADDMGWNEVGFNGGDPEHTPHIDRLRSEGVSLTQFYSHAVCAPTRAAFLTGRYAFRTWSDWRPRTLASRAISKSWDSPCQPMNKVKRLVAFTHWIPMKEPWRKP